jgi:hypothetical protein
MIDRRDVDDLLAPGALTGHERDRVLDAVLGGVAPPRRTGSRSSLVVAAIGIAACVGAAVAVKLIAGEGRPFASRGSGEAAPHLELVCSGGSLQACPRGAHLVFGVTGGGRAGYLTAYAEPKAGGERIWYFPSGTPKAAVAPDAVPGNPVERVIAIGQEHQVGRYSVHVLVTTRPLSRPEALQPEGAAVLASDVVELDVVP